VHLVATIGENMTVRRVAVVDVPGGVAASYVHGALKPGLGKIGVIVGLSGKADAAIEELGKKIGMHVAATPNTSALNITEVDPAALEREKAVLSDQARASGKPEAIIEKMVEGRIKKFYEDVVLLEQVWVHDGFHLALAVMPKSRNSSASTSAKASKRKPRTSPPRSPPRPASKLRSVGRASPAFFSAGSHRFSYDGGRCPPYGLIRNRAFPCLQPVGQGCPRHRGRRHADGVVVGSVHDRQHIARLHRRQFMRRNFQLRAASAVAGHNLTRHDPRIWQIPGDRGRLVDPEQSAALFLDAPDRDGNAPRRRAAPLPGQGKIGCLRHGIDSGHEKNKQQGG
jgi:hypothetical protein